jgi:trans-AT polyketide synthase, acyltransferase and oxidoreductase domains
MRTFGYWSIHNGKAKFNHADLTPIVRDIREPIHMVYDPAYKRLGVAVGGEITSSATEGIPIIASLPATYPEWLGDQEFMGLHGLRFAYIGGALANGISSSKMVIELASIGMLGFLGTAGMSLTQLEKELKLLSETLTPLGRSWGVSLIHTPQKLFLEEKLIDLYLKYGVRRVSAAAFLGVTPAMVRYAASGLSKDEFGQIKRKNYIFAKISHPEIAKCFLAPAPEAILCDLVSNGSLSQEEAVLARRVPLAEVLDVEGDSGGHTDNRPLNALFPLIANLCNEMSELYGYKSKIFLGAAGGIGTPQAVAAAFVMGASHIVVGSVHQTALEADTSKEVKTLLSKATIADVIMTASADMFEMGVKVQVLKRGTMMGTRGNLLYDIFKKYNSLDSIPEDIRKDIEQNIFRRSLDEVWEDTRNHFKLTQPAKIDLAERDPKYKLASVFKWYLGNTSRWAITGNEDRLVDYQIWCGPAMGAFNDWVKGSFLEPLSNRSIQQIALNLMEGGAVFTRFHQMRTYGLPIQNSDFHYTPEPLTL